MLRVYYVALQVSKIPFAGVPIDVVAHKEQKRNF